MAKRLRIARATKFAAGTVVSSMIVFATIGYALLEMRQDAIDTATMHATDMAAALADGAANNIATIDLTLRDAVQLAQANIEGPTFSDADSESIHVALEERRRALGQDEVIGIADASGRIISASEDYYKSTTINIADRDYFIASRDDASDTLHISKPYPIRRTGVVMITFARRIASREGKFLGIALVGVKPIDLFRDHDAMTASGEKSFSLFYEDGTVALRQPDAENWVGKNLSNISPWRKVAAQGGGVYHSDGVFDAFPKYLAVRRVVGRPFFVNVGVADQLVFMQWRPRALTIIACSVIALALVGALLYSQTKLASRLARSRVRSWVRAKRILAQESELGSTRRRFALTLDYISQAMAMFDADDKLIVSNHCYAEIYGLKPEQLRPGMSTREIFALRIASGAYTGDAPEEYMGLLAIPRRGERLDELRNGRVLLVHDKSMDDGGRITVQEDVTERIRAERELIHVSRHDSLTQLPNRLAFKEHLARSLAEGFEFAVLLADIDGFKDVNDTYGHEIGDRVLIEVASRLRAEAGDCLLARLGGDEFIATTPIAQGAEAALALAERFIGAIQRPFEFEDRRISLGLSVGVKIVDPAVNDASSVMRHVDLALYAGKNEGRNRARLFHDEMERDHALRAVLARDLGEAIAQDRLDVHYQPIVDASDGRIVCMEALARWRHPTRGMIPPVVFIPLAEEIGMINALGNRVLDRACADAARWRSDIVVAVNVSSLQVERPDFVEVVTAALARAELCPHKLQLEITETVLLRNNDTIRSHLLRLRALGVTFALDDFGTGYASLAYLKAFPLDKLKIDKSFVDDVCVNPQSITIVGAIVALATGIGVETTAEGVETKAQADALRAIGVTTMQGYFFSKPKPIGEHDPADIGLIQAEGVDIRAA